MAPILNLSPELRTPTVSQQASVPADYQPGALPKLKAISVPGLAPLSQNYPPGLTPGASQLSSLVYQSQQGFLRIHSETWWVNAQTDHIQGNLPPKKTAGNLQPATGRTDTRAVSDSTNCRSDTLAVSDSTAPRGYASAPPPPPQQNNRVILLRHGRPKRPGHLTRHGNRRTLYQV